MKPSAKIVLDERRALSTGKFPVKIRVMFTVTTNGKRKSDYHYYSTGEEMFPQEFEKLYTSKALADRLSTILKQLNKANSIIEAKPFINKSEFDFVYTGKGNYESVQGLFDILQVEASKNGQVVTAGLYGTVKNNITKFVKSEAEKNGQASDGTVVIGEINVEFLEKFEAYLLEQKMSYNSVGIYCRYIRVLFNWAIDDLNLIPRSQYPFGRRRFVPPATTARKIALTESQKNQLLTYQSDDENKQKAVDFWKLSYFCFGLNMKDILSLQWKNFEDDMGQKIICIFRGKTFGRKRIKRKMVIPVTENIDSLIKKYSVKSLNPDAYVFDVFEHGLTPIQIVERKDRFLKFINGQLADVSGDLGLPKITTYSARHTFAYIMMSKGVSTPMIQQMMDHEDQKTTENYMGSFETAEKLKVSKFLY